jgi:hypothetical protein
MLKQVLILVTTVIQMLNTDRISVVDAGWTVWGSNTGRGKGFFSCETLGRLWDPHNLLLNVYNGPFSGIKRTGREVDHSRPSMTKVRNEWRYASAPPLCVYAVDRVTFTFTP